MPGYSTAQTSSQTAPLVAAADGYEGREGTASRLRIPSPSQDAITAQTGIELRPLGQDDPRWAKSSATAGSAELKAKMASLARDASSSESLTDRTATAAIPKVEPEAAKAMVASYAPAIAREDGRLDAGSNPLARSTPSGLPEEDQPAAIAAIDAAAPIEPIAPPIEPIAPVKESRTNASVNMRVSAGTDADIIALVPGGASVGVLGCEVWCEVAYEGQRGWMHGDYINGYETSKPRKDPPARKRARKSSSIAAKVASPVNAEAQDTDPTEAEVGFFKSFVRGCVDCETVVRQSAPAFR